MIEAGFLTLGLLVGGIVAWLWSASRWRAATAREMGDLRARLAATESTAAQIREQLGQRDHELADTRRLLDAERQQRVTAQTRLEESAKHFEEQRQLLAQAENKLKETFEALSAKALQTNAEQFLNAARKTLDALLAESRGNLGKHAEAISGLVKPLAESLKRYEDQIHALEQARLKAYGALENQVQSLAANSQLLQQETSKLVTSLRDPRVRGRWGEIALRRAAELAGLSEHCDFEVQVSLATGLDERLRPDMVVHLPGGRTVVVDAKAVLDAYLDAVAATDDQTRQQHLARHAAQIRGRIRELASKSYWDKLGTTPEFVVLFLPAESFFSAAVELDPTLIEDAIRDRVVLASPTTLIALLRAVAYGWRQEQIAENAEHISQLGRELFDRMRTLAEHLENTGKGLARAVQAYNQAVGSLESRVLPPPRNFKELAAGTGDDIPRLEPLERAPRQPEISGLDNGGRA